MRALTTVVAAALVLGSMLAGYSRQISPEEAATAVKPIADFYEKLRAGGDEAAAALELFSLGLASVAMCNIPVAGPAIAVYLGYSSGTLSRALEVHQAVLAENTLYSSVSSVLQLAALVLATAEGLYLSVVMLGRKESWEPLETAAIALLQASLVALASILEAASIFG